MPVRCALIVFSLKVVFLYLILIGGFLLILGYLRVRGLSLFLIYGQVSNTWLQFGTGTLGRPMELRVVLVWPLF